MLELPALLGQTIHKSYTRGDMCLDISGTVFNVESMDIIKLRSALEILIKRHAALRTIVKEDSERKWRLFVAENIDFRLDELCYLVNIEESDVNRRHSLLESMIKNITENINPFSCTPLIRVVLFDLGDIEPFRLLIVTHHFICDGISTQFIARELLDSYNSNAPIKSGKPDLFEFACYLKELVQRNSIDRHLAYWTSMSKEHINLPGVNVGGEYLCHWDDSLTQRLRLEPNEYLKLKKTCSNRYGCYVSNYLLGIFVYILTKWLGNGWIAIANWTSAHIVGQHHFNLNGMVGNFSYPVFGYFYLDLNRTIEETIKYVHDTLLESLEFALEFGAARFFEHQVDTKLPNSVDQVRKLPMPLFTFNFMGESNLDDNGKYLSFSEQNINSYINGESYKYSLFDFDINVIKGNLLLELNYPDNHRLSSGLSALSSHLIKKIKKLVLATD